MFVVFIFPVTYCFNEENGDGLNVPQVKTKSYFDIVISWILQKYCSVLFKRNCCGFSRDAATHSSIAASCSLLPPSVFLLGKNNINILVQPHLLPLMQVCRILLCYRGVAHFHHVPHVKTSEWHRFEDFVRQLGPLKSTFWCFVDNAISNAC